MAWFTDPVLYGELVKQKRNGLTIEIVADDNPRNREAEFNLEDEFPTHWVIIQSLYKNIMHDKFCIIDLNVVIHGTFNWTKAASYNKETITIDRNRNTAERFADEFMKLKK
ncbi:MAG: phospholipase D-like domain-containing protein [Lentisphaeria bacterium]